MSDTIRRIRSFVRREGRFTPGQQQAWERLMPQFGIEFSDQPLDFERLFGRDAPVTLEIGSGNGETLVTLAAAHPENDYIGIEVHRPGVGRLLRRIEELELSNVRVICHDAVEVVERMVLDASLDAVLLYFPDPWHKKRHHKRRIVQPPFVTLIASRLKANGLFHLATDWEDYAYHMVEILEAEPLLENSADKALFVDRPEERPLTKFEQRGLRLGHGVWDLHYRRRL
ncbi:tRNA (guanosine(46)-N7)-methyltransferase TrmB [Solemya pervernicosa gill symbiont]|uniref:tRNA (guanine-N(7)-)-methyltransferase n=1 Tax=Solemya pervernicosa gill symbiont TaxID=642797 RepID=A0A1T2L318_9GAMM|nr:tRNA (guanosine(46)-N7)-methyltransferase TrmB [Solemya pervernicosa gill symbiont]OOZ39518.1 tRNA (guanosine(46)-N7)-methyltransferase TrmB [Solemya pervernicosa gill symbiont]